MSELLAIFPTVDLKARTLSDGCFVLRCQMCRRSFASKKECLSHYEDLRGRADDYYQCPFGFTSRTFLYQGSQYAVTGVVAHPRFDTEAEREVAKRFPLNKVTRYAIGQYLTFLHEVEALAAAEMESGARVLQQSLHELRKLNAAILQHSEREARERPSPALETIRSAAELMRNSFDILEAMSNIESIDSLPMDSSINLFDLAWKTKKVYEERARTKGVQVYVEGVRAIISGSTKSFPIVLAVLIENAIKYSNSNSVVNVTIAADAGQACVDVENFTELPIDVHRCFEKGVRFAGEFYEGSGFGLYLAKQIVAAHRGTIVCYSMNDQVLFSVRVPLFRVIA